MSSFWNSLKIALLYIRLGVRELFKYKKFLLSYFLLMVFLSVVITSVARELYFDGGHKIASLYFWLMANAVSVAADIFIIQYILGKYRRPCVNKRTLGLCFLWATSFLIFSVIFSHLLAPLGVHLTPLFASHTQIVLGLQIFTLIKEIALAAIMVWVGYYPFLLLESAKEPFRENLKLIKKCGLPLAVSLVLVWYTCTALNNLTKIGAIHLIVATGASLDTNFVWIAFEARRFLVYTLLELFPPAVVTVAFLRETGERAFLEQPKLSGLLKNKT